MDRKSARWKQKDILRVHVVACMIMYMQIGKNTQTWSNLDEQTKGTNMYRKPVRWKGKDVLGVYVVACKYISTKQVSAAATELKLYQDPLRRHRSMYSNNSRCIHR
jgi:hypothetical protein